LRLLMPPAAPTLYTIKQEVFSMKTSNLVALMIALIVSAGGFTAIDLLFTQAAAGQERPPLSLLLRP